MGTIEDIMSTTPRRVPGLPLPVQRALRKFGSDIRDARLRRRIPLEVMAERAFVNRKTVARAEHGDPIVSIATYATLLFILGMVERLADLADAGKDRVGLALEQERLPKRIRNTRKALPGRQSES
jgi:transcriptional regulator with XRE-family HTH domain